ncbi:MAG: DUF4352 domain-containing protein [Acidobacteriota bacterium]|nr:DUF4352 domain-containing protein [Acidobacteriota bacterium]
MLIPSLSFSLSLLAAALVLSSCAQKAMDVRTVHLGEKVQAGSLSYNAFDTQWLASLGEGANSRLPVNRFFLVRVNIVNGGRSDATVPTLTLLDDSGQSYNEMTNGDGVPNWMGIVRKIRPADSENGNIAFDVPPRHYRLRVGDESDERFAYVDIPLNFTIQTPAIPPASDRP